MARRGKFSKAALLMGAAAVAAGVLLKRDKVAGLLSPGSRDTPEPSWTPSPPPAPSNYDAPGPVANTATPVPAPEPEVRTETGAIDEAAEEAAAAAEAANIGGTVSDYADVIEEDPDESRPWTLSFLSRTPAATAAAPSSRAALPNLPRAIYPSSLKSIMKFTQDRTRRGPGDTLSRQRAVCRGSSIGPASAAARFSSRTAV